MSRYSILIIVALGFIACNKETVVPVPEGEITYHPDTIYLPGFADPEVVGCFNIVTLGAYVENATYLWSPGGETTQTITLDTGAYFDYDLYTVQVTTVDSSWIDSVYLITFNAHDYAIPTAFSPNGDGVNDIFNVYAACAVELKLIIYNTSGSQMIFESRNINVGWDGTYDGEQVRMGEYPYRVDITFVNGEELHTEGTVQLLR